MNDDWKLVYETYDPPRELLREALCTLGNGYFATRGAAPESTAGENHYPGTYIAGVYNRRTTKIAGQSIENECLVNVPNWLVLRLDLDGERLDPAAMEILDFRQELDLKQAILTRSVRVRDTAGRRVRLEQQRLVSMDQQHLGALQTLVEIEDGPAATLEVLSALDGGVRNEGVARYRDLEGRHLEVLAAESLSADTLLLEVQTNQSHLRIAQAATTRLWLDDRRLAAEPRLIRSEGLTGHRFRVGLAPGQRLRVEKRVALYNSRDAAISEPGLAAGEAALDAADYAALARRQRLVWGQLWEHFDFDIEHDDPEEEARTERILRLHILHLIQTTSPHVMDLDVGVPARGLHGEAYRGHIFWDELFVFPLFNLRMPEITRALLRYRHRRLGKARQAARESGCRGAMYPWQSGSDGREESQRLHLNPKSGNWVPDRSHRQRHINAAVAYNVWQYYQVTGDMEFLSFFGAEMILEIARFWSSIATYDSDLGRYGIYGVMGPDEYHDAYPDADRPGLDNNAYTNVMAVWVLQRGLELREVLPARRFDELCELLELSHQELAHWEAVSQRMYVPFHDDGIISQFDGYERLEEFDWQGYRDRYGDIQRLDRILEAEGDTPNRYKVSKQADVLMLFYLFSTDELEALFAGLGYYFDADTISRNVDYYVHRTAHGSTLSRVVHSWVLARANRAGGWPLFKEALHSDVDDIQGGTTHEGIHTGAMAGTVDLVQRCFAGIATRGDVLWLTPCLPEGMRRLTLNIRYRRIRLDLEISPNWVRVSREPAEEPEIRVGVGHRVHSLSAGEVREFRL